MAEPTPSVLFVCTGNSARSQMAEALLRQLSHGAIDVASAGTEPKPKIHPMARAAMQKEFGIDMTGQYPKSLDRYRNQHFDYIITLCDQAVETCPVFPGDREGIHWSFDDPAATTGTDDERQRAFNQIAKQLLTRMRLWLSLPALRDRIDAHQTADTR